MLLVKITFAVILVAVATAVVSDMVNLKQSQEEYDSLQGLFQIAI